MYSTTHNPNDANMYGHSDTASAGLDLALRIEVTKATEGWCVDISTLLPCVMDCAREDLLKESTLLCGDGRSKFFPCYDEALSLVATSLANYGSFVFGEEVSPPELGLVDRLLERTGFLSIQSIETEVYSTFIDIGISTSCMDSQATIATIYDIFSDSWHGD